MFSPFFFRGVGRGSNWKGKITPVYIVKVPGIQFQINIVVLGALKIIGPKNHVLAPRYWMVAEVGAEVGAECKNVLTFPVFREVFIERQVSKFMSAHN